jgi:hypothetical protein
LLTRGFKYPFNFPSAKIEDSLSLLFKFSISLSL